MDKLSSALFLSHVVVFEDAFLLRVVVCCVVGFLFFFSFFFVKRSPYPEINLHARVKRGKSVSYDYFKMKAV